MKNVSFKTKILSITLLPLIFVSALIITLAAYQAQQLGKRNVGSFSTKIYELRRQELKNYTEIAKTTLDYLSQREYENQNFAEEEAKEILRHMSYGNDGYFFAYDRYVTLAHPKVRSLEGKDQRAMTDPNGVKIIEELYQRAAKGGGYTSYVWLKPSRNREVEKISYSIKLDDWNWWLGTGLYADDLEDAIIAIQTAVDSNISTTLKLIISLAIAAVITVGLIGARITLSEGKLADDKLKLLSQKAVQGQEEERRRVSLDLQKGIIQTLGFVRSKIKSKAVVNSLEKDEARTDFTVALSALNKTIKEVYRISGELRPEALDKKGLFVALDELVTNTGKDSPIIFSFKKVDSGERLKSEIETAVYRITQEAINNIIKHSQAKTAKIRLREDHKYLSLTVQDDGVGFEPKSVLRKNSKVGVGFVDMRIRAESLGGSFHVFSSKGSGTFLKIDIPIK